MRWDEWTRATTDYLCIRRSRVVDCWYWKCEGWRSGLFKREMKWSWWFVVWLGWYFWTRLIFSLLFPELEEEDKWLLHIYLTSFVIPCCCCCWVEIFLTDSFICNELMHVYVCLILHSIAKFQSIRSGRLLAEWDEFLQNVTHSVSHT